MATKDVGKGTILSWDVAGGSSYIAIAQIKRIKIPKSMMGKVDVTCLDSVLVEYIPDEMIENGELTFDLSWDPDLTGHQDLRSNIGTRGVSWKVTPPGNSGTNIITWNGFIMSHEPGDVTPKGELTASITVQPTTILTWAA